MKEKIKKEGKQIAILLVLAIVILLIFLYGSYCIEISKSFQYQDEITGEYLQDMGAKNIAYIVLTGLCIYAFIILVFLQDLDKRGKIKVETVFLFIVPVFCILLTIAMPMSKGHDETIHGLRIYEYAEGKWISNGEKANLEEGVINALDTKMSYKDVLQPEKTYDTNTEEIEWGYRIASYSPINYLPQVVSIAVARIFTNNSMIHLYIARLANMITCTVMLYVAIKIIPFGKNMLFLLSMIPIAIEGFSTLSADGMLISASFLWIAFILKLREEKEKKIERKEIAFLSVLAIIISLSKTVYIVILPLLLLLPKEKFRSPKTKIAFVIAICSIGAILDIGWYVTGIQRGTLIEEAGNQPIATLMANPLGYLQKLIYTIVVNFSQYLKGMFGGEIEWNEEITIPVFPVLLFLMSIIISKTGTTEIIWKKWEKLVIGLVILSCLFTVFTSLYISWSETEITTIRGIQGRYFLPILPLVFLLFGRKFLEDEKTTKQIAILGVLMQIIVILELVIFHI